MNNNLISPCIIKRELYLIANAQSPVRRKRIRDAIAFVYAERGGYVHFASRARPSQPGLTLPGRACAKFGIDALYSGPPDWRDHFLSTYVTSGQWIFNLMLPHTILRTGYILIGKLRLVYRRIGF